MSYITKQRVILHEFIDSHADEYFTSKQISECLKEKNISLSAVYRNMPYFEEAGIVQRQVNSDSKEITYRFNDKDECRNCIHMICSKCGKVSHIPKELSDEMAEKISKTGNFQIDKTKTTFYGICEECSKGKNDKS